MQMFENLTDELVKLNIRPSFQRIKILEYLYTHRNHPTAEQIYEDLKGKVPSLSKATVYNTLMLFADAGLVQLLSIEGHESRYDVNLTRHGHFKCMNCKTIYDFHIDIDKFKTDELKEFQIEDKEVYFKGLCPGCHQ